MRQNIARAFGAHSSAPSRLPDSSSALGPLLIAGSTEYLQECLGVDDLQAWSDLQDASRPTVINALRRASNWWPIKARSPYSLSDLRFDY